MTTTETHKRMKQGNTIIDQIAHECLLMRVRKLDRVLTSIYDAELRPFGLKASQTNLLVLVAKAGPIRRIEIGKRLCLDPSTLTRNLKIMLTNGWIQEIADGEMAGASQYRLPSKVVTCCIKSVRLGERPKLARRSFLGMMARHSCGSLLKIESNCRQGRPFF